MLLLPLDSDLKLTAATKSPLPTVPITYLHRKHFLAVVLQRSHEHTSVCVCARACVHTALNLWQQRQLHSMVLGSTGGF